MNKSGVIVATVDADENPLLVFTRQELVNAFRQWDKQAVEKGVQDISGEEMYEGQADYLIETLNANKSE